ncbi:anthocyanidin-3-O-glucoside rhamnosyltransferase-like [Aristolochia californica]|uniref:anthocyanidin-3-O-glucoside rhamnosyltransferase-like n=1 Tax=Aristolochia californica TaxID=171875 RepID=UPI0035DA26AF
MAAHAPLPETNLHVAMFPWFAFGHINPFVQLANKIASHGVRVSILSSPGNIPRITSALKSGPCYRPAVLPVDIPTVDGLPPGVESTAEMSPAMAELLKLAADQMGPQIEALFEELRPDIIVFDFAMQWLPPIAHKLGIKSVFFSIFNAITIAYLAVPSRLTDGQPPTIEDLKRPPAGLEIETLPTFKYYECREFHYVYESFGGPCVVDRWLACVRGCDAFLLKTCLEMEGPYVKYIETQYKKPVLLAGPVVPDPPSGELEERWAEWLTRFPKKSVILCSFGSEVFLKDDQIKELAWGLEMTGAPFILVLKFSENEESRLKEALPEGFLERVKEKGMVHTGWIPQQLLLAHPNVGYFITHAGSSSIIEGPANGLQIIFLPQRIDQFLNTKLVVCNLRAGVEVNRNDDDGFFTKDDLCEAVKAAMACERGAEWKDFLRNGEKQEGFTRDLVEQMKEMVSKGSQSRDCVSAAVCESPDGVLAESIALIDFCSST